MLGQPAGDQADDPHRPGGVAEHDRRGVVGQPGDLLLGPGQSRSDGPLAVEVLRLEPLRERPRLLEAAGQAETQGELGVLHPAGGIDPGGDAEGEVGGAGGATHPGHLEQRPQPGRGRLRHRLQAGGDDGPVLAAQGHHVGHRSQGGQSQAGVGGPGGHHPLGLQPLEQLPGHPGPGQGVEGIAAVRTLGVDQGVDVGEERRAPASGQGQVVIGDHQAQAGGTAGGHVCAAGAAVDADHAADTAAGQLLQRRGVEPVALGHPVGDVGQDVGAGGDPVGVVVAVDRDRHPLGDRQAHGDDCLGHPRQAEGVVKGAGPADQLRGSGGVEPAGGEDAAEHRGQAVERRRAGHLPAPRRGLHTRRPAAARPGRVLERRRNVD